MSSSKGPDILGESLPEPNIIPLTRIPLSNEPPLPDQVLNRPHEDVNSEIAEEWDPLYPYEGIEGTLVRRTPMTLGGTAYVFDMRTLEEIANFTAKRRLVLLKKGGRILDSKMQQVEIDEQVYVRYLGELEAKPGQNPARDWRVVRIKSLTKKKI